MEPFEQLKDGKVELDAAFLEKFLADQSTSLEPIGKMLGIYYHTLVVNGCSADIASILVRDVQTHLLQTVSAQQQLKSIKRATDELNKAVADYKEMMEGLQNGE